MVKNKPNILGGIIIRKKFLNPNKIILQKRIITRKSLRGKSKVLDKFGTVYRIKTDKFVIREFSNKEKASKFKSKLIKDIKRLKKK